MSVVSIGRRVAALEARASEPTEFDLDLLSNAELERLEPLLEGELTEEDMELWPQEDIDFLDEVLRRCKRLPE